ncbi:hypothetical protein MKX01_023864 [Papaver californicum]|nr:hypothetical protein MKX01_023864 [Papaver californicum]
MLAFVRSQNGALAEAIQTSKNNFDKNLKALKNFQFVTTSSILQTTTSLDSLAGPASTNFIQHVFTSGFLPLTNQHLHFASLRSDSTFDGRKDTVLFVMVYFLYPILDADEAEKEHSSLLLQFLFIVDGSSRSLVSRWWQSESPYNYHMIKPCF